MAATGNEHGLRIRVFGDRAALEWHHEDPEHLHFRPIQDAAQVLAKGRPGLSKAADAATRLKIGHVEGVLESFANIYMDIAAAIYAKRSGEAYEPETIGFPTIEDGVYGVKFVEAVLASHEGDGKWVSADVTFE
jgi:predicted dehydrogenase